MGLMGWFILLPSVLIALGAVWLILTGVDVVGDTRSAEGRVIAHRATQIKQGRALGKLSVVEFAAHDGRSYTVVDSLVRMNAAAHIIGEKVTVRYPTNDPSQAQISGSAWIKTIWGVAMLFSSSIGMLLGWLLLRFRPKAVSPVAAQ